MAPSMLAVALVGALSCTLFSFGQAKVLYQTTFKNGFYSNATDPSAMWGYYFSPLAPASITFGKKGGMTMTDKPYQWTFPQNPYGFYDHVKFGIFSNKPFTPGKNGLLRYTLTYGATGYGTENHPFGSAVMKPNDDFRLATCTSVMFDPVTYITVFFLQTNEGLYATYTRPAVGRNMSTIEGFRAWSQIKRIGDRKPGQVMELTMQYSKPRNSVAWRIGREVVAYIENLGTPAPGDDWYLDFDLGGQDEVVHPPGFQAGWFCYSLLDSGDYWNRNSTLGLVRLGNGLYVFPSTFVDDKSEDKYRMFGQGAKIEVKKFLMEAF